MMPIISAGYSCREVTEAASAFLDGEMTWSEWARYRVHLLTCPPCNEYVRQMGLTVDSLRQLGGDEGRQLRSTLIDLFDDWSNGRLDDLPDEGEPDK